MRLREIEELLHAVHQPFAPHAASANRDERLNDLKTVSERVVPGIEKRERAAAPVRRPHHDDVNDGQRGKHRAQNVAVVQSRSKDHDGGNQHERHRCAEVGLEHDEPHQSDDDDADGQQGVPDVVDPVHAPFEQGGDEENRAQLRQLGGLHADAPQAEPPPGAVHRRAEENR